MRPRLTAFMLAPILPGSSGSYGCDAVMLVMLWHLLRLLVVIRNLFARHKEKKAMGATTGMA